MLRETRETIQTQETLINLATKPLPSLPKNQNKFQRLGKKVKSKLQQMAKLVKREKSKSN